MIDDRLQRAMEATVRVNGGSGTILAATKSHVSVIATARHVVETHDIATVRWSGGMSNERVLARDSELDIALVDVPRGLESDGLELATCDPGDEVWLLGFPMGWELAAPLLSRGNVAGLAPRSAWVDGSASWGHSGGPVIRLDEYGPLMAGTVIGAAGKVHRQLEEMIRIAADEQELVERTIEDRTKKGMIPEASLGLAGHATTRVRQAMDLIRSHFRAGFVEMILADSIEKLRGV